MGALTGICVVFCRRALLYYNYMVDGPLVFTLVIQWNSGKRCRVRYIAVLMVTHHVMSSGMHETILH
jgi:hypothetical protein